jgi:3-(3-hydroxy-phenyl)propionate hydroxylase
VAIVGAGPVALVSALTLARDGVASVAVDRRATFNDRSRANRKHCNDVMKPED